MSLGSLARWFEGRRVPSAGFSRELCDIQRFYKLSWNGTAAMPITAAHCSADKTYQSRACQSTGPFSRSLLSHQAEEFSVHLQNACIAFAELYSPHIYKTNKTTKRRETMCQKLISRSPVRQTKKQTACPANDSVDPSSRPPKKVKQQ